MYSVYLTRVYVVYRYKRHTYEIWLIDCWEIAEATLLARIRLIGLLSVLLSCERDRAVRTIASELPAKTQRLYCPSLSLFN